MQKDASSQKEITVSQLTDQEKKLIALIRELKFGELHLFVADGKPVRAEQVKQSVKF